MTCPELCTGRLGTSKRMPYVMDYLVTYFVCNSEKAPLNKALKNEESPNVPAEIKEKHEQIQDKPTIADTQEEADALRTPPDPSTPSGVLSVIVHQINIRKPLCLDYLARSAH